MLHETEHDHLRRAWAIEPPADDLADRIIHRALAQPQRRPLLARWKEKFTVAPQAYAMRGLAVAACLTLAIIAIGQPAKQAADGKVYQKPLDQVVEELIWSDYSY